LFSFDKTKHIYFIIFIHSGQHHHASVNAIQQIVNNVHQITLGTRRRANVIVSHAHALKGMDLTALLASVSTSAKRRIKS